MSGAKTELFVRKQKGGMFTVVNESKTTGDIFFVDSGSSTGADSSGYGKNPDKPFLTWDYAIGQCTASNGDRIYLMPGHAETLTTAGDVTIDVVGTETIGIGNGADRPTFTFSSADNSASVLITAASTKIRNILGICGDDGLTNPFHVQAADCELDITWRDPTDAVEAAAAVLGTASADRLKIKLVYEGRTGGNACVNAIRLVGTDTAEIDIDFYGKASTSIIEFKTTLCTDVNIRGYFYNSGTTDLSKNVVDTATSSTWSVDAFDGAAGCAFSGGSGATPAKDDLSSLQSDITVLDAVADSVLSDLIVADAIIDTIASDLVVTQSDVKVVISDLTTTVSDMTIITSDLASLVSDLTIQVSDFTVLASDISSDLAAIETDTNNIYSDTTQLTSDVIVIMSDVKVVGSDLIVLDAIADTIASDLVVVMSDVKVVGSDLIVLDALVDNIGSDVDVIETNLNTHISAFSTFETLMSDFVVAWEAFETIMSDFVVKYESDNP